MELLVRTRNGRSRSRSARMNRSAPGIACSSWTSTPSMSISHDSMVRCGTPWSLRTPRLRSRDGEKALVVLAAGGASLEMGCHATRRGRRVGDGQLGVDELVEAVEALLAADLGLGGAPPPGGGIARGGPGVGGGGVGGR